MNQSLDIRLVSLLRRCVLLCLVCLGGTALADPLDSTEVAAIRALLTRTQPDMSITRIEKSPVAGLYQVQVKGSQTIYVSADAKFLIPGDLYQATADGLVNLGEQQRNQVRRDKIAAVNEKDMIVFAAKGQHKATITVFTDVDCPYCRKLHGEISELNKRGITVRYLAYPRTGLQGETYRKMISTWCAADRKAVFTDAKLGGDVPLADCVNPVDAEFRLGQEVGVNGTPSIVLEDGTMLPGYVPADTLAGYLFGDEADAKGHQ